MFYGAHMEQVAVRQLRKNLSQWLRRVRSGEAFEITDRGEPIAVIAPLPESDDPLTILERRGLILRRGDCGEFPAPTLTSPIPTKQLLDDLRENRG